MSASSSSDLGGPADSLVGAGVHLDPCPDCGLPPTDPRCSTRPTLGRVLIDALADHGAKALFGIPGDFVVPLFREARRSGRLPLYGLTHEPAVGFAADAAARLGGGLGVALVTWGAGALNLVNPIANAYAEKTPLVVVSGAPGMAERKRPLLIHHQVRSLRSQAHIMAELTVDHALLEDPRTAPSQIARVLRSCREHSRPVYLEVPRDLVDVACAPVLPLPPTQGSTRQALDAAARVLAALRGASRPALLIDVEVRRYGLEAKVIELARRLSLPVLTTFSGRGLLAGSGLVLGTWLGRAGAPHLDALIRESDLVLGLGLLHSDTNLGAAELDLAALPGFVDARDGLVCFDDATYTSSLAAFLDQLLHLEAMARSPTTRARRPLPQPAHAVATAPTSAPDEAPTSDEVVAAVEALFARHGAMPVVSDVGDCLFAATHLTDAPLIAPAYYATMGYAIPAALGVCAATEERPLVLVGDGAFQMTGAELVAATPHGWDPIVIIFDNQGWKMVSVFDHDSPDHALPPVDFAAFATSLGARGVTVRTRAELGGALDAAHAERGRAQVLHVHLAPGTCSAALARFVAGVSRRQQAPPTP